MIHLAVVSTDVLVVLSVDRRPVIFLSEFSTYLLIVVYCPVIVLYALFYGRHGKLLTLVGQLASNTFHNILLLYSKMLERLSFRLVKEK
jgi:hypothetical protein